MTSEDTPSAERMTGYLRGLCGLLGLGGLAAGTLAVFTRDVEAGPVALLTAGSLFLIIALAGALPSKLKIGDTEAEWQREVREAKERIKHSIPVVSDLLDTSGASLENIVSGRVSDPGPALAQAGTKAEEIAKDVQILQANGATEAIPAEALLELGRWHLSQQDWTEGARYLDEYTRRGHPDWEAYFTLGVAQANRRNGPDTDRAALRAYDMAMALTPSGVANGLTPRIYSYRAAIKKRLGRLVEARADAEVARLLAERRYDRIDATYNLACIASLEHKREEALRLLTELESLGGIELVHGHMDDYFAFLRDDPEFHRILNTGLARSSSLAANSDDGH